MTDDKPSCVLEIVKAHLVANGYDGLYCDHYSCACEVSDLMPCKDEKSGCMPGHKIPCNPETCEADGDCPWHIGPRDD